MATLDYQVSAGGDDGYFMSNSFNNSGTIIYLGSSTAGKYYSFARFPTVTIPVGAQITAAYLSTYRSTVYGAPTTCNIYFVDQANPTAITSGPDGTGRPLTTTYVVYTIPTTGTWNNTNDIKDIIQELVNSYDYHSGSAMEAIFKANGTGSNYTAVYSYNGGTNACPKLHIEYSLGGGVGILGVYDSLLGSSLVCDPRIVA